VHARILLPALALFAGLSVTPVLAEPAPTNLSSDLRSADRVVVGQVVLTQAYRARNHWGDNLIVTRVTVRAEEILKGAASANLAVDVEGGTIGTMTLRVSDLPTLKNGERAVFLLKRNTDGSHKPYNRGAGILKLNNDNTVAGADLSLGQIRRLAAQAR
jgi:hypothetical protein